MVLWRPMTPLFHIKLVITVLSHHPIHVKGKRSHCQSWQFNRMSLVSIDRPELVSVDAYCVGQHHAPLARSLDVQYVPLAWTR